MLQQLKINNYALIDNLEISFGAGLNILTGETGAGKSIILGALSLILGQRAESRYFFNQQKKCIIEGTFQIGEFHIKTFFEDNDLDYAPETVLRREISADGKSRAFVNDTPVNLTILKQLGEKLIDIHSQHATLEINDPAFQLLVIDSVAKHPDLLNQYHVTYRGYKSVTVKLKQLLDESERAKAELDYHQFQFDELEKASLSPDEQEKLEQELFALNNAGDIKRNLSGAHYLMDEGETPALLQLREASHQLTTLEKFDPLIAEINQRLKSSIIELKDIASEIETIEQRTFINEERALELNARLTLIYNLQKKHRVSTNAELLQIQQDLSNKIQQVLFGDEEIEALQQQIALKKDLLQSLASGLSANRTVAIPLIEKQVQESLSEMGMGNATLKIENAVSATQAFDQNGIDHIRFLFSANKGYALSEMSKVASGGELSRLMLSIKSLIASNTALPTIIFDEIDTGVSGEVANKVGQVMERLSQNLQVITITHLPQIASKGPNHYFIYKDDTAATTYTRIKPLTNKERVVEIAKMLSGDNPGDSALQNARELLKG
ncbi:DNA replication and repair protein RecN [Mucilaginibacter gracilis]|uniref:DNA repair protein RecN n=1 Tax=Mucilaginibacter gracilis TaxID=423350 RepID=A0A495IZP6_9SPHI|nr:DNA repair protein RecN [Mucilaginibacter gracilis]RKR81578.1 DNA replication and repair protein RecN [Mucilaginibacter gracilis]